MVRFEPADDARREPAPVVYLPGAAPGMKRRSPLEGRPPASGAGRASRRPENEREGVGAALAREAESREAESRDVESRDAESREAEWDAAGDADALAANAPDTMPTPEELLAQAEKLLLDRLRRRSLSIAEALALVLGADVEPSAADDLIARFTALGYLDDTRLADQVVHSHHDRKGLGRSSVEAEMRRRRILPEVILQTLEEIPDDEQQRCLDAARKRVMQLARYDDETIERRLTGFLMRKGYASSVVRTAVKDALATVRRPSHTGSVRFR